MEIWQYLLAAAAGAGVLALAVRSAVIKRRLRLERDFTRTLETVLQPRETVKVVCPNRHDHWILTSRRLLLETKDGFLAIPFSKIKSLQGQDSGGKTTASPGKMARLVVKTDQSHILENRAPEFASLVRQLKQYRNKSRRKGKNKP